MALAASLLIAMLVAIVLAAEWSGKAALRVPAKLAASAVFVAVGLLRYQAGHPYDAWIVLGLVLGAAGDLLLALPMAMLAGYGLAAVTTRLPRWRSGATIAVAALVLFEYLNLPAATVPAQAPQFYERLPQEEPGEYAVLDLPLGRDKGDYYMFYQTVHGHPIVEGNTARPQPYMFAFIQSSPLLHALRQQEPLAAYPDDISRQLQGLADSGIRYIVLHKPFLPPEQVTAWRSFFALAPTYEDEQVLVYRTAPRHIPAPAARLGDNIALLSSTLSAAALPQAGVLQAEFVLATTAPPTRDWVARLALVSSAGEAQAVDVPPCAGWPTSAWDGEAVARSRAELGGDPFIAGGEYTVTLALVNPGDGTTAGPIVPLGRVTIQAVERVFAAPPPETALRTDFGDDLRLLGYDLACSGDSLTVTLHWQARQRMETAYKMFVHLLAPDGSLVAQADVIPHNWSYPTNWWEAGEVVSDEITLPLEGVPPGRYRFAVGVYDPATGERLPAYADGQPLPDNRRTLETLDIPCAQEQGRCPN